MAVPKRSAAGIKGRETSHDGGYSWVVLAASFMMSVHYSFSLSHFGIFLVEYIEYFNVKKSTLIWIGALLLFVGFALGMYNMFTFEEPVHVYVPSNCENEFHQMAVNIISFILYKISL